MIRPILCALLLALSSPAMAGMPCGAFKAITQALKDTAGEEPVTEALGADGKLWVMFAARGGATWSLVSVDAAGRACMVMIGKGFGVTKRAEGDPA